MTPTDPIDAAFAAHGPALLLYARQWLDAAAAEDAVQRVFVRLITTGRLPADVRPWLFRCVRNEAISQARSARRRACREAAADAVPVFLPDPAAGLDAAAAGLALATLPPAQREVVVLRIWSGLTLAEIGAITGLATSTVHDHYRAALASLQATTGATMTDDDLTDALTRLPLPRPSPLALGYAAGRAAGRRRSRVWQAATGVAALLAVAAVVHRPPAVPTFVDRVVYVRPPERTEVALPPTADASSVLRLREAMLGDPLTAPTPPGGGGGRHAVAGVWMTEPPPFMD